MTWERLRDETGRDTTLLRLAELAEHGFPAKLQDVPGPLAQFWRFRDRLSLVDGVIMYENRAVVPEKLRAEVLRNLHSAHQGVTQMRGRAETAVFWPGMTSDIQTTRERCLTCDRIAPSQR